MLVAELITSGELDDDVAAMADRTSSRHFSGETISDGIALGHVVLHEPRVTIHEFFSDDLHNENLRLDQGLETLRASID